MPKPGYFSLRITDERRAALAAICARLRIDSTKRGSVGIAIDYALHRTVAERSTVYNESRRAELVAAADAIYGRVFGHLDDKFFSPGKTQEIFEWLYCGDLDAVLNIDALAAEWREYDADDVAANTDWHYSIETCQVSDLTALDLRHELTHCSDPVEAARVTVEGQTQRLEVLYCPEFDRGGIATGDVADWTTAHSLEQAVERYLRHQMRP